MTVTKSLGNGDLWGTDTPISLPVPPSDPILVDMGSFGITTYGIAHNLTSADLEAYVPKFLPVGKNA